MSNVNKGKAYQQFVETVYKAIIEAQSRISGIEPVELECNKKILSASGTFAEIDIYWEYQTEGETRRVALECKDHNKNIDIPKVRDFCGKIRDLDDIKGIMVTTQNFSEEAVKYATYYDVALLVIKKPTKKDWEGCLESIDVTMSIGLPVQTTGMKVRVNEKWLATQETTIEELNNSDDDLTQNDVVFEDIATGFKSSLWDLENNIFSQESNPGKYIWHRQLTNGWVHTPHSSTKIDCIDITFVRPERFEMGMSLNFEDYVLAVMEYINEDKAKLVISKKGEWSPFNA